MKFIIGSNSERKIRIAGEVIREFFNIQGPVVIEGYEAMSGVPETPYDRQTFDGARNRAQRSKEHSPEADYCIGLESGLVERYGHIYEEAWSAVVSLDGKEFFGYSSGLKVPDYVLRKMDELHMEHCNVMTLLEKEHGTLPNDTWGSYSGNVLIREISLEEALRNALVQVVAPSNSFYKM